MAAIKIKLFIIFQCQAVSFLTLGDGIVLSIPILSIYEIKKFQKQYLEEEKLLMLNPGIELVTMNCLFFKVSVTLSNLETFLK